MKAPILLTQNLGLIRIVQPNRSFVDSPIRFAFEAKRKAFIQRTGVAGNANRASLPCVSRFFKSAAL
jgi:hypothetical protein